MHASGANVNLKNRGCLHIMLQINKITLAYNDLPIFKDLSIEAENGKIIGILGQSGIGKSTLIKALSSYIEPNQGSILINKNLSPEEAAKEQKIGLVQQSANSLMPHLTVFQNVALPLKLAHKSIFNQKLNSEEIEKVNNALYTAKIKNAAKLYPHELSGGMLTRTMLARAIVNNPAILLLDEAFSALDDITCSYLYKDIQEYLIRSGAIIIIISHKISEIILLSDEIYILGQSKEKEENNTKIVKKIQVDVKHPRSLKTFPQKEYQTIYNDIHDTLWSNYL